MDEKYRRFFQTEGDVSGLDWAAEAFYQVYSRYFSNEDYYIAQAGPLGANLRPIRETIEIADDDLTMSWEQFIEFQTGYPLRVEGAEILSWELRKCGRMGTYTYENGVAHNHFGTTFNHTMQKNRLMQQGGVIIAVIGHWGNPLTDNEASADGGSFDVNKLTNRDDWLIKTVDDVDSPVGKLSASEASINLFYGGDTYVPDETRGMEATAPVFNSGSEIDVDQGDVDSNVLGTGSDTMDAASTKTAAAGEPTTARFWVESWYGGSYLSGITFI